MKKVCFYLPIGEILLTYLNLKLKKILIYRELLVHMVNSFIGFGYVKPPARYILSMRRCDMRLKENEYSIEIQFFPNKGIELY